MKSTEIYQAERTEAFNDIKHQRDSKRPQHIEVDDYALEPFNQVLFRFQNDEAETYSWIIQQAKTYSLKMFSEIVFKLLDKYNVPIIPFRCQPKDMLSKLVMAFVTKEDKTLYTIQCLGSDPLPESMIKSICSEFEVEGIRSVLMVHDYVYRLRFNHTKDENDPTRGTGLYSIKYLFTTLFGIEEYDEFKKFEEQYTKDVRHYLGYEILRTLTPNALYNFKNKAEYAIQTFPYKKKLSGLLGTVFPDQQFNIIRDQFITQNYYRALLGQTKFAQSFVTAEWLYDSMKSAGEIDYTAVIMGYFKAVEQLLYDLVSTHVGEGRTIRCGKTVYPLTEETLRRDKLNVSLGSLIGFLKYFANRDLFRPEIRSDENTQELILAVFDLAKDDRNGYFHKDNIDVEHWNIVDKAHDLCYVILFLLLGGYEFADPNKAAFGIQLEAAESDFYRLCKYINYNAGQLFYISFDGNEIIPVFAAPDDGMKIDKYGEPEFSGIYFRKIRDLGSEKRVINATDILYKHVISTEKNEQYDENRLPIKIYTGEMKPEADGMSFSGPLDLIYENGRYMLPEVVFDLSVY